MPRYAYRCVGCFLQFNAFHGFHDKPKCPRCSSSLCERIPSVGFNISGEAQEKKEKTGEKVNKFIEEAKQDLKQQKKKREENR